MDAEPIDALILERLNMEPGPWSISELGREMGSEIRVRDSVARLAAGGLALRMADDFVVVSATGRRAHAMAVIRP